MSCRFQSLCLFSVLSNCWQFMASFLETQFIAVWFFQFLCVFWSWPKDLYNFYLTPEKSIFPFADLVIMTLNCCPSIDIILFICSMQLPLHVIYIYNRVSKTILKTLCTDHIWISVWQSALSTETIRQTYMVVLYIQYVPRSGMGWGVQTHSDDYNSNVTLERLKGTSFSVLPLLGLFFVG